MPELLATNNCTINGENKYLNGKQIANNSPFNYTHIIPAGTQISGLQITSRNTANSTIYKYERVSEIPPGYITIIRPRAWWSNNICCSGEFLIKNTLPENSDIFDTYNNILKQSSNYDYLERVQRFLQISTRKSP